MDSIELFFYRLQDRLEKLETNLNSKIEAISNKFENFQSEIQKSLNTIIESQNDYFKISNSNEKFNEEYEDKFTNENVSLELPCKTAYEINELEKNLKHQKKMCKKLLKQYEISGREQKFDEFIRSGLHMVWAKEAAVDFSWAGFSNHISVKNFKIINLLKGWL